MRITKSEISMRAWRSFMSAAPYGAFVVIPEISPSDISYRIKRKNPRQITRSASDFYSIQVNQTFLSGFHLPLR